MRVLGKFQLSESLIFPPLYAGGICMVKWAAAVVSKPNHHTIYKIDTRDIHHFNSVSNRSLFYQRIFNIEASTKKL